MTGSVATTVKGKSTALQGVGFSTTAVKRARTDMPEPIRLSFPSPLTPPDKSVRDLVPRGKDAGKGTNFFKGRRAP